MAGQDKTEAPTPKRLADARKKGQLPVSKELGGAAGLLALFGALALAGPAMFAHYKQIMRDGLLAASDPSELTISGLMAHLTLMLKPAVLLIAVPAAAVGIAGVAVGALQTKFNIASEALKPDFKRLNPAAGLKRLLGPRGLFEVGKEILKVTIIGTVAWMVLWPRRPQLATMVGAAPQDTLAVICDMALTLGIAVGVTYLALAAADYFFQRWQTMRELKMTKEEVKQEHKNMEMSQEMKRLIKQRQREAAQKRMLAEVPTADVIITNPTHYAVALRYELGSPAPRVVAKGTDAVAARIRAAAENHDVQIVPNPPLARALHATCELGAWVPEELFVAVAEVLAYVYQRREQSGGGPTA